MATRTRGHGRANNDATGGVMAADAQNWPNLIFEKHWRVGLIGYCLGDRELIDWGLSDPVLSARDRANPSRADLAPAVRPRYGLRT